MVRLCLRATVVVLAVGFFPVMPVLPGQRCAEANEGERAQVVYRDAVQQAVAMGCANEQYRAAEELDMTRIANRVIDARG